MPRFSRFIFGGVVGAGLALLFAPRPGRELRHMLMGGGRRALPPGEPGPVDITPSTAPSSSRANLESRIAETRRQIETQLGDTAGGGIKEDEPAEGTALKPPPPPQAPEGAAGAPAATEAAAEAGEQESVKEEHAKEEAQEELEAAAAEEDLIAPEAPAPAQGEKGPEVDQPAGQEPASAESWEEEITALKTPAAGEPEREETGKEEKPAAGSSLPEPSGFDQEEMRRRIDATRARLKAKAFDAMVSGETFIETEADKSGKQEKPAGPQLEDDVEKQIDASLKEED